MTHARELEVALEAAARAGRFIRGEYDSFTPIPNAPASISTHVDRGSQELIFRCLREHFPADGLCGEETLDSPIDSPAGARRVWVIDPIDGTRGFVMKNGEFSVMIGLTVERRPVVGVVLEPVTLRYTYAAAGGGCWTKTGDASPTRCRVTDRSTPEECTLVQSRPKPRDVPTGPVKAVRPARVLEMYSAGVKLALVARGEADVYVNTYPNFRDWDTCAGHILVEEAGGRVSGFRGEPLGYGGPGFVQRSGMVASNGAIHDAVVGRLRNTPLG
jgi:3'(2'), 5'-bisphosphate nucleotidase